MMSQEPTPERKTTTEQAAEEATLETKRNFAIPGCSTCIDSAADQTTEDLLSIAFSLANGNPGAPVKFSILLNPDGH